MAPALLILAPIPEGVEASYARIQRNKIYLKADWSCTVTQDEHYPEVLRPFVSQAPGESAAVSVQLGFCVVTNGKYAGKRVIEVRLGGRRAGELTQAMTARYEDLVDDIEGRGAQAYCDGYVQIDSGGRPCLELLMPRDPSRPKTWVEWHRGS